MIESAIPSGTLFDGNDIAIRRANQIPHNILVHIEAVRSHAAISQGKLRTTWTRRSPIASTAGILSVAPASPIGAIREVIEFEVAVKFVAAASNATIASQNPRFVPIHDASIVSLLGQGFFSAENGILCSDSNVALA